MKKIVFNATILNNKLTGLGVYCRNILERIDKNIVDKILFTNLYKENGCYNNKIVLKIENNNKIKEIFLRNYKLNRWIEKNKESNMIFYSPTHHGITTKGIKQIITIHDLIPLYYPKGRIHQYIYYKYKLKKIIEKSDLIITVSNNTKKDILKQYSVDSNKIKVIYNGFDRPKNKIEKSFSKRYVKDKYGVKDYILMVGIHYNYKNLHSVIKAYSNLKEFRNTQIVIVGNNKVKYGKELEGLCKKLNIADKVKFLGFVDDYDKEHLYRASKVFVYPSKYEGFGLPVLEAMANETVVACSNSSSLPEVVGDAAYTFDPNNISQIEKAIYDTLTISEDKYTEYINRGKERIKNFSWDKCAKEVKETILAIANEEK
jgi:glycosyltransferase involved in cell wall biosynthesis